MNEHVKFFVIINVICDFLHLAVVASAAPPGFFECLQAALRETGQQLHVQIFGSMALFKQPLLFASVWTVLGMEESIVLFCAISKSSLFMCRVGRTCISVALNLQF